MNKVRVILLVLLSIGNIARGDIFTESFFRLPPDAVSRSVGGANQAYSIGAADVFINPALLSQHTQRELQFSNMITLLSKQYLSVAFSSPLNAKDHIGIGLIGLDNSLVDESSNINVRIREPLKYQFGFIIAYSRSLFPFSLGASIKYIGMGEKREKTLDNTSSTGINLGFSYIVNSTLRFGFIYQSPFYVQWNSYPSEDIPGRMGISAAWIPPYFSGRFLTLLLSVDGFKNEPTQMNLGIVITAINDKFGMKNFDIRGGLGNLNLDTKNENGLLDYLNDSAPTITIGAGLGIKTSLNWIFYLDYCFQIQEYINSKHIVTTRIGF